LRVGELKRYSGSCKARRIDQIKAGLSNVIHGKYIYTKMWLYCPIRIKAESSYQPVGTRGTLGTMEEEWYDYCEPMRRRMNKWMSECQDKYIVVQPIGMRRKVERGKGERESIWWRYR